MRSYRNLSVEQRVQVHKDKRKTSKELIIQASKWFHEELTRERPQEKKVENIMREMNYGIK